MIPLLSRRGKLVVAAGVWFALIGTFYSSAPLVAMGVVVVSAMMTAYLWFFSSAVMLRRQKIELSWWIPPGDGPGGGLFVDRPFQLHVAIRNHGYRALRVLEIEPLATAAIETTDVPEANVPTGTQVEVTAALRCHHSGYQVLHGAFLKFGDILGFFALHAYFPNPIAIKVFPRPASMRSRTRVRPNAGSMFDRAGLHLIRRRGLSGELREIREHAHGDPFKFIAWKPTARRQKLMVREHENEIVTHHHIIVDIGPSMRSGTPGRTKLDYAIDTATSLARAAIDQGDRVGLVTFDTRVYSALKAKDGHHHLLQIVDRLIETNQIVAEDLTDTTNGELVAAVAAYLARQEAVDVRLRRAPPLDDELWDHIQAGHRGELYDLRMIDLVVQRTLDRIQHSSKQLAPRWWWQHKGQDADARLTRMRLFCRLRGIEIPYRQSHEPKARVEALSQAIDRATRGGACDSLTIISDLDHLLDDELLLRRALSRARSRRRRVVVLAPFEPAFAETPTSESAQMVAAVLADDIRAHLERAKRVLSSIGVPVLEAGPADAGLALGSKLDRAHRAA